ncbi:mab-21 domain-containing protein, partial [Caerostris extrusa]
SLIELFLTNVEISYPGLTQVRITHSGPARTILILYNFEWISIDLVPVFSIDPNHLQKYTLKHIQDISEEHILQKSLSQCFIVPKPLKKELSSFLTCASVERAWRIHFPETEKSILQGKYALKPLIKLMKDLRDKERWPIASYFIKMVAFWLVKEYPQQYYWNDSRLGLMFLKFLEALEMHLKAKHLGHILYPKFNLFHSLPPRTIKNLQKRVHNIIVNLRVDPKLAYKLFRVPIVDLVL